MAPALLPLSGSWTAKAPMERPSSLFRSPFPTPRRPTRRRFDRAPALLPVRIRSGDGNRLPQAPSCSPKERCVPGPSPRRGVSTSRWRSEWRCLLSLPCAISPSGHLVVRFCPEGALPWSSLRGFGRRNLRPYFACFFGAFVFSTLGFGLIFFPGGTQPQPQFSFLAHGITSFRPFRFLPS